MENEKLAELGSLKTLIEKLKTDAEKESLYKKRLSRFDNLDARGLFKDNERQILVPGLYVVGAPPSLGKTTWTLQLCSQLADQGEEVWFLSYEMAATALLRKMIARELFVRKKSGQDVIALSASNVRWALKKEAVGFDDVNAVLDEFSGCMPHLRILNPGWNAEKLPAKLLEIAKAVERPPVIAIDYLQLISSEKDCAPRERVDRLLNDLRNFQTGTDSTIFLISALNRVSQMYADRAVRLESFKESGSIEYTADVILSLELVDDDVTEARKARVRRMKLRCLKNREGALFEVFFKYFAAHDYFEPCTKEDAMATSQQPESARHKR